VASFSTRTSAVGRTDEFLVVADDDDLFDAEVVAHRLDQRDQLRDVARIEEDRRLVEDQWRHRGRSLDTLGEQSVDRTPQAKVEQCSFAPRAVRLERLAVFLIDRQPVVAVEIDRRVGVILVDQIERLVQQAF